MDREQDTQLWMGGVEVEFVKWLPNGLIYTRVGSQETIASLTRGTVRRLLSNGLLKIEGYHPDWAVAEDPASPVAKPSSGERDE